MSINQAGISLALTAAFLFNERRRAPLDVVIQILSGIDMQRIRMLRREAVIAGLGIAVALAAATAIAYRHSPRAFHAHRKSPATCRMRRRTP